jgi:hypothetical protein
MYFLKYIGFILFSVSLNEWKNNDNENDINNKNNENIPFQEKEEGKNINNNNDDYLKNNIFDYVHYFLSKFLINGNNLKILNSKYQLICIIIFSIILSYVILVFYGFLYMKKKYYDETPINSIEKKLKKINSNTNLEKILFKIISYFFFFFAFVHQYIIEYIFFGFLGYILNLFRVFELNIINKEHSFYIEKHLKDLYYEQIAIIIINGISIIIVLAIFILFMIINSTKTLFLNNGFPLYGNKRYLLIKIIIFNLNPLYGVINSFTNVLRNKIIFIIIIIIAIIITMNFLISYHKFSWYSNQLSYICIFIEFFSLFAIISELILYLTNSILRTKMFYLVKLVIQLLNSFLFTLLFIYKKDQKSVKEFADNLFNKTFKSLNPNDIYFYIISYIKYAENKDNNYIQIFKLI